MDAQCVQSTSLLCEENNDSEVDVICLDNYANNTDIFIVLLLPVSRYPPFVLCLPIGMREQKENFDIQHQLNVFTTHFYWLRKKIDKLEEEIPLSLPSCFEEIDSLLEHKTATRTFRSKFVKKSEYIPGFSTIKAAEIYKNAIDLYKHINLYNRLNVKEPSMQDLKIIFSNKQDWMEYLAEVVYKSVFSAMLEYVSYNKGKLTDIKVQLQIANLMPADDDMDISEDSTTITPISDEKIVAEIQFMPLLDYIFNIYTAEILHHTSLKVESKLLFKLGYESLCADPKHLAHIRTYVEQEPDMVKGILFF
ncbi:midasin [Caerostris extrusa]|uniref:Midasin n=1 Tax=Caerostris extrusa TaxID=172846 RepID=A0AAV4V736_CAEEX|nr:midasin [Caerostris extrusa]